MTGWIRTLFAYGVLALGPALLTLTVVRNSSKLTAGLMNGVGKVTKMGSKMLGKYAQGRYERGTFNQMMQLRKRSAEVRAKQRAFERFGKTDESGAPSGFWANALTAGIRDERRRNMMRSQVTGADSEIYRADVKDHLEDLGRKYSSKEAAEEHYWNRVRSGDVGAAEMHALNDHMLSFSGGASWMDKVMTGQITDQNGSGKNIGNYLRDDILGKGEMWKGAQRSLLADSSKFKSGSPDAAYAMQNYGTGYVNELAESSSASPEAFSTGTRPVDKFLGKNWTAYEYDDAGNPIYETNAEGEQVQKKRSVSYTEVGGKQDRKTLIEIDPNGGLEYTSERAKNMMGFGSRMAEVQEDFGLTDTAARAIIQDSSKSQIENKVVKMAERKLGIGESGATPSPQPTNGELRVEHAQAPIPRAATGGTQFNDRPDESGLILPRNFRR